MKKTFVGMTMILALAGISFAQGTPAAKPAATTPAAKAEKKAKKTKAAKAKPTKKAVTPAK